MKNGNPASLLPPPPHRKNKKKRKNSPLYPELLHTNNQLGYPVYTLLSLHSVCKHTVKISSLSITQLNGTVKRKILL